MSDRLLSVDGSVSDNSPSVERKCLTDYRNSNECPTKRSELESDAPLPYPMNSFESAKLVFKVFAVSPLTLIYDRHDIKNELIANYL